MKSTLKLCVFFSFIFAAAAAAAVRYVLVCMAFLILIFFKLWTILNGKA